MPIITMFSGSFCEEGPVVREIISRIGYRHIIDDEIVAEASRRFGLAESKIKRSFTSGTSVFNNFTHEKERSIAYIKLVVADMIAADNVLITCFFRTAYPQNHQPYPAGMFNRTHKIQNRCRFPATGCVGKRSCQTCAQARRRLHLLDRFSV